MKGTVVEEAARSNTTRLVLDLTDAHPAWGPTTHEALVAMIGAWRGKSIVLVAPEAITRMGLQQVCKSARVTGRFVSSVREVERPE
jgi:hypothetical protein